MATIAFAGAHASIGYLVDASLGATSVQAIAMIPAIVAYNTDLSAWLSASALHAASTALRSDGIPRGIQAFAAASRHRPRRASLHSSLMTCGSSAL